jgi:hypothetical protein
MRIESEENRREEKKPEPDPDLDNCKGQCGYTPWCKDCEKPQAMAMK